MTKRASMRDRPITPQAQQPRPTDTALMGAERASQVVLELLLREIMPNRRQPRTQPSAEGLEELAASIREHGLIQPVLVRSIPLTLYEEAGRSYELIAGERRWRASALAGKSTISAIVVGDQPDDRAMLELAIIENLQREDLHPLDEAMAFERMQSELSYSYAQIADRLGKSKGYVQNRMRLLSLDEDLQHLVAERPDTLGHVYELARLSLDARADLVAAVRDDALSRAETRSRVEQLLRPTTTSASVAEPDESYFQKYDRDEKNNRAPLPAHTSEHPGAEVTSVLSRREHALIAGLTVKVKQVIGDSARLTAEDWSTLAPLAEGLRELLERRHG